MQWDEKIVFIQPVVIIIIIVISLCPFPLAYDVCWSFIFSLYVPINNLSQILQILVPGIDNYPVCDIKSVVWVLGFVFLHNLQRTSTIIISFYLQTMQLPKKHKCYRRWNHTM